MKASTFLRSFVSPSFPGQRQWLSKFSHIGLFFLFVVTQLLSHVRFFATLWTAAHQAPLSSLSLLRFMSIVLVMASNCHPLQPHSLFAQHQGLFHWVSSLHQVAIVLELQHQRKDQVFCRPFKSPGSHFKPVAVGWGWKNGHSPMYLLFLYDQERSSTIRTSDSYLEGKVFIAHLGSSKSK